MKSISILLLVVLLSSKVYAQPVHYNSSNGIAIGGYDPLAYFLQGKAVEGNDNYSVNWSGSKWRFSSQANLDSFKRAPLNYAPQYGGFCAYGCSENHKAPTDPGAWTIINNKLYLNDSLNVKQLWLKDTSGRIKAADKYWPVLNQ